ncbi:unnamed protein product [Euphydryas editha]|uniref:Tc1-like transposase DDE domain-containing protein n=1 Tax=Euphydryas editha TaxID=104508 RepID=A0AAU9UTB3_EUPED|nr:unnamed protein product [Euphydryas editha]
MPKKNQSSGRNILLSVYLKKTVSTITKEGKSTSQKITTPRKKRIQEKKVILDDFDLCALRNNIHEIESMLANKKCWKSGDYHDDMNKTIRWLQEKLIPNLPVNSLVVMDNAPYHTVKSNKAPTLSSIKAEMQNWIINKGLFYLPTMVKAQLYEIIKEHKEAPIYEADQMLQAQGHKVAKLPPYHCELNSI